MADGKQTQKAKILPTPRIAYKSQPVTVDVYLGFFSLLYAAKKSI
jgi:hypothetical protein